MKYVRYNAIRNGCMLSIDSIHWADKGYFPTSFKFKQFKFHPKTPLVLPVLLSLPGNKRIHPVEMDSGVPKGRVDTDTIKF